MAQLTAHTPGTFCWVELASTDQRKSVQFYRSLFGWDVNDRPLGPGETYSMFLLGGQEVAAAYTMGADEELGHAGSRWNMYISVENADRATTRAQELGARVLTPPFDVMEHGRMAVLQDPTGAVFRVWEPRNHIGATVLYEPGALCWSELTTRNPQAAETFYGSLFAWMPEHTTPATGMEYIQFGINGQQPGVGMMRMPATMPASMPSYWMPYFQVVDCDASTSQAQSLGATLMVGPRDIPQTGRFTILQDPQGAMFAVFALAVG